MLTKKRFPQLCSHQILRENRSSGKKLCCTSLVWNHSDASSQLYDAGFRNFLIMNVPPIDRAPATLARASSFRASMARYIGLFNLRLKSLATSLAAKYPETTVFQFDTNLLFTLVLNNPTSFAETSGFTNIKGFCPAYKQWVFSCLTSHVGSP